MVYVQVDALRDQVMDLMCAWGMPHEAARVTSEVMSYADTHGIDSHGVLMLPLYDEFRRDGRLDLSAEPRLIRDRGATCLWDGAAGLGHYPSTLAMNMAIDKARSFGIGMASVRGSHHYGAAGAYAMQAARQGLIGLSTSAVYRPGIVPTGARVPMLGTNPIAFAAPGSTEPPFCLDMATSTVAVGKLKLAKLHGKALPEGWSVDQEGKPVTDPVRALDIRYLTPLGALPDLSSHKGYGLATMVELLSTVLSGACFAPLHAAMRPDQKPPDVGHFFMAIYPDFLREEWEFEADLDAITSALRKTPSVSTTEPVQVAGDPERREATRRQASGIPLPGEVAMMIKGLCAEAGCSFRLEETI
ncbi:MAG: Ldh family oxidoreductase [Burkholderiaceae bacterium]